MKTIFKKMSAPLGLAVAVGMFAVNAHAIELDPSARAEEPGHGTKIVHHVEARVVKLGELLTQHTKNAADKTEAATTRAVTHLENDGHKVAGAVKRTADKIEAKINHLTD